MGQLEIHSSDRPDPRRVADVVLATVVRSGAEVTYIEPSPDRDLYTIAFERGSQPFATIAVDGLIGAATIARFAYLVGLDLASNHPVSSVVPVRSGELTAELLVTVRPGDGLRCEIVTLRTNRPKPRVSAPLLAVTGDVIGNYRVIGKLGEGGMGTVFRVEHVALGRHYALKVIRSSVLARDPNAPQRFLIEARAAARVQHPHIVDVFDFGHTNDGRPYYVMELIEGESLNERCVHGAMQPTQVVSIGQQIADALGAVHARGVIHADVKASNALIVHDDPIRVKLSDFGLAAVAGEQRFDDPEVVQGSPHYIAPEVLCGTAPTDRSDQYALGVLLFKLLSGHPPYEHTVLRELCMMHIEAPIPVVTSPFGPLPPALVDIVTTCLQKSPQARFPGMPALIAALEQVERVTDRAGWRRWLTF